MQWWVRGERALFFNNHSLPILVQKGHLIPIIQPQISMKSASAPPQKVVNSLGPGRETGHLTRSPFTHWPLRNSSPELLRSLETPRQFSGHTDMLIFQMPCTSRSFHQTISNPFSYQVNQLYSLQEHSALCAPEVSPGFVMEEIDRRKVILLFIFCSLLLFSSG